MVGKKYINHKPQTLLIICYLSCVIEQLKKNVVKLESPFFSRTPCIILLSGHCTLLSVLSVQDPDIVTIYSVHLDLEIKAGSWCW